MLILIIQNKKEGTNEITLQNIVKNCIKNIENQSYQHYLFWLQLSEEIPDLEKISSIGKTIFKNKI